MGPTDYYKPGHYATARSFIPRNDRAPIPEPLNVILLFLIVMSVIAASPT